MSATGKTGPFQITISFKLLKKEFESLLNSDSEPIRKQAARALEIFDQNPKLYEGFSDEKELKKYKKQIDELFVYLFPPSLTNNEIKAAIVPNSNQPFYLTERLKKILGNTGEEDFELDFGSIMKQNEEFNAVPYAVILNKYYQYHIDFSRPKHIVIPQKDGSEKVYRVAFNADFLDMQPTENSIDITPEILDEILFQSQNLEVWQKYFPESSWKTEGFGILSLTDVTVDRQIARFKEHLIASATDTPFSEMMQDIRGIFGIPDLKVGSTLIDHVHSSFYEKDDSDMKSLILNAHTSMKCADFACDYIYKNLFEEKKPVVLSNVPAYHDYHGGNQLSKNLLDAGIHSILFLPIQWRSHLIGILEIASPRKNELNAINMTKLNDIIPFIESFTRRSREEFQNQIDAVIQKECTSIHPSVLWRFREEAIRFIKNSKQGNSPTFNEIVFEDVHPLYGQIDIIESSNARNTAIQKDLELQLQESIEILNNVLKRKNFLYYEQLVAKSYDLLEEIRKQFQSNTEQLVIDFFEREILPVLEYIEKTEFTSDQVTNFLNELKMENNSIYKERKNYDHTVNKINKKLSRHLEKRQIEAQKIFPHYFEQYKTDGVEHNLYIGQSIAQNSTYHESLLHNLRLWQLQVMCEMEFVYNDMREDLKFDLDVASLILALDSQMSIRYRIDEKHFDVDGAYNVRYEIVKKRIDKILIKKSDERLTKKGYLSVVYSNPEIEKEYLEYLKFLKKKGYVTGDIQVYELEEVQGVSGMFGM